MADGVKVKILGDDSDLQSKLKGAGVSVAKWAAASVAAAAAAGIAITKSGLESADALAKESTQLGTTSKDLVTLRRAADMAGVSQNTMSVAARTLRTRMGEAAQGTGEAVAAFDSLGISLEDLQGLPISEQIEKINTALSENVSENERAAVAADLFGSRAGLAVSKISGDTIATAARQVEDFGAALSDVDAAKIENANDTMSQMGLLTQSVSQGLAAQFAPVLDAVAGKIFDAAKETDGFKTAVDWAFDAAVTGAGLAADAFHIIQTVIKSVEVYLKGMGLVGLNVAKTIVGAFDYAIDAVSEKINVAIRAMNELPGIDINELVIGESESLKRVRAWSDAAGISFEQTKQELRDLVNEPWPSDGIKQFVADAQEAGQAAAEAAVKARENSGPVSLGEGTETGNDTQKEELEKRLEAIREGLLTEQEAKNEAYALDQETLKAGYDAKLLSEQEYQERKLAVEKKYNDETLKTQKDQAAAEVAIQTAATKAKLAVASGSFGNLATLMDTENRKLFEIGKAAALAQATIDGYQAIQSSYAAGAKIGGPYTGAAFAATAAIATGVQISKIASTSFGGGGGAASASGTGGGSTSAAETAQTNSNNAESAVSKTLLLQGDFDSNSLFSGEAVRNLMDKIAEAQADGYKVIA